MTTARSTDRTIGVTAHPARHSGEPCVGLSRVPAETIARLVWDGMAVTDAADDYGLTPDDVYLACWYIGRHGTGPSRMVTAFCLWANANRTALAKEQFDQFSPPPRRQADR